METIQKQYLLEGLCCGNCAAKIKKDVQLVSGVRNADINADTAILSVEIDSCSDLGKLSEEITRIAVEHDEDIIVQETLS